ncbi:Glucose-1-phosphate adenylyltransferase [Edwardsiella tarda]|nr:Glucose-1-phosphate adenylyltransferase [Edwardsiella tarda]
MGFTADGEAYWRDVGTLDAYWEANIDLISTPPRLDPFDPNWPIISKHAQLAPARFKQSARHIGNKVENALIGGGCIIDSAHIQDSILSARVEVSPESSIEASVLMPEVYVGRGCRLRRCVIDRGCRLPDGLTIGEDAQQDARYFHRSPQGIVLVTQEALARLPARHLAPPILAVPA